MAGYSNRSLGISIMIAIAMHNIPEGISVAMPVYFATGSKLKALKYTFLSGIAEPVGALLAFILLRPFINDLMMGVIFAIITGVMLYLSIEELIPSSRQYGYKNMALISTFANRSHAFVNMFQTARLPVRQISKQTCERYGSAFCVTRDITLSPWTG